MFTALVPMETLFEWIDNQANAAGDTVQTIFIVGVTIVIAVVFFRTRGALAALVGGGVTAAIAYWLVAGGGIAFLSDLVSSQASG